MREGFTIASSVWLIAATTHYRIILIQLVGLASTNARRLLMLREGSNLFLTNISPIQVTP